MMTHSYLMIDTVHECTHRVQHMLLITWIVLIIIFHSFVHSHRSQRLHLIHCWRSDRNDGKFFIHSTIIICEPDVDVHVDMFVWFILLCFDELVMLKHDVLRQLLPCYAQLRRVDRHQGNLPIILYHQHMWSWCWCTYWYAYIVFNMCGDGVSVHGSARRFTAHWPRVTVTSSHRWRPSPLFFIPEPKVVHIIVHLFMTLAWCISSSSSS